MCNNMALERTKNYVYTEQIYMTELNVNWVIFHVLEMLNLQTLMLSDVFTHILKKKKF